MKIGTLSCINDATFIEVVKKSRSYKHALEAMGVTPSGGNYNTIKKRIEILKLDVSHMTGSGWNLGKRYTKNNITPLSGILVDGSNYNSLKLKERLIDVGMKERICEICNNTEWMGERIPLHLHHVNGKRTDNRIENIKIICPNCHSQTDTYCGKNVKRSIKEKLCHKKEVFVVVCNICGGNVYKYSKSKVCRTCNNKTRRKAVRPDYKSLRDMVASIGYRMTGKKYNVSHTTVKRWILEYEITVGASDEMADTIDLNSIA